MTPQEFCYWLQGYLELSESPSLSSRQTEMVKRHLALVFTDVTTEPEDARKGPPRVIEAPRKPVTKDLAETVSKLGRVAEKLDALRNHNMDGYYNSPLYCEHANEMPLVCPCSGDCYCKMYSCKSPDRNAVNPPEPKDMSLLKLLRSERSADLVVGPGRICSGGTRYC